MMDFHRQTPCLLLLALSILAPGCADQESAQQARLVSRDSAGITIVDIPGESFANIPQLTLDPAPILSIGVVEGEESYMLAGARLARSVGGDSIVAVNGQTRSLRFYRPDGAFLREVGRRGEGPGEYQFIDGLTRLPDGSLTVWDSRLRRITRLEPDGRLRDTWALHARGPNESWVGGLPDESILLQWVWLASERGEANQTYLIRAWPDREQVDTLMATRGEVTEIMYFGAPSMEEPVFSPSPSRAVDSASIWLAPGGSWEVRRLTAQARPVQILRPRLPRRTMTQAQFDHWADSVVFQGPWPTSERPELRRIYDRRGRADSLPSVGDVQVGTGGRIWLREYPFPGVVGDRRWLVLEPTGTPVAWVTLPPDFTPWEFGREHLLGVRRDDLGVQYIERRALVPLGD